MAAGCVPPDEELIAAMRRRTVHQTTGDDWLKFGAFKLTLDGGMTIGTAFQRYPYGAFGKQLYGKTESRRSRAAVHSRPRNCRR